MTYTGKRTIHSETGKTDMQRGICSVLTPNGTVLSSININGTIFPERTFDWGYYGVYPSNLARSMLVHYFGKNSSDVYFNELVRTFCYEVISNLPFMDWSIEEEELKNYLKRTVDAVYGDAIYE